MEDRAFDALAKSIVISRTRRRAVRGLLGAMLGALGLDSGATSIRANGAGAAIPPTSAIAPRSS